MRVPTAIAMVTDTMMSLAIFVLRLLDGRQKEVVGSASDDGGHALNSFTSTMLTFAVDACRMRFAS